MSSVGSNTGLSADLNTRKGRRSFKKIIHKYWLFYVLLSPALIATFVFAYIPIPGIVGAFLDYDIYGGYFNSPFVGLKHFKEIFEMPMLASSIPNTVKLSVLMLICTFPCPIILALLFNELRPGLFKRVVQTISYLPNFLSWISIIGLAYTFYDTYGTLNNLRVFLFGPDTERVIFVSLQAFFIPNLIILSIWKGVGWGSIVYLASIASIDPNLYEAAKIDGANRWQQVIHITIPGIFPMINIFLILSLGGLFSSNFELVYGMQNPFINFETIDTVVFKQGILGQSYSLATAVGFMQGVVAFLLVAGANKLSKMLNGVGII